MALLEIRNLSVSFDTPIGTLHAVEGVDMSIERGEVLCIVGESGSGKSMSMLAVLGLVGGKGRVEADVMAFNGQDLTSLTSRQRRKILGKEIGVVFQDARAALDPCYKVGPQISETLRIHHSISSSRARDRAIELMHAVGIAEPEERYASYPHQMSGGMNQRISIAMAICCRPLLLIADEPTSALDVTVKNQILNLLTKLQAEHEMALALITHDMGIVARLTGRVQVVYAGQIVEEGPTTEVLAQPRHPYTQALLRSRPELAGRDRRLVTIPGTVPGIDDRPEGCLFSPRCLSATDLCRSVRPQLLSARSNKASCHFPLVASDQGVSFMESQL